MKLCLLSYQPGLGWSRDPDTGLDSPQTLVLAFGASSMYDNPGALRQLLIHHRQAQAVGCSTAGEIFGTKVSDGGIAAAVLRFERAAVRSAATEVAGAADSFAAG